MSGQGCSIPRFGRSANSVRLDKQRQEWQHCRATRVEVALLSLSVVCLAVPLPQAPNSGKPPVPIVSQEQDVNFDGNFHYSFEGGDGTKAVQDGQLKQLGDGAGEVSRGAFSYVGDDGRNYGIQYVADENGFQPTGDHLPQPPPIPEAIAKALAYLATAPPSKDNQ